MTFIKTNAPHMRTKRSTFGIMIELTIALLVLYISAVAYNFIQRGANYGVHALLIGILAVVTALVCDAVRYLPKVIKSKNVKEYISDIGHSYSYVTALILAMLLPVGTSYYVVAVCTLISVVVAKYLFGGFGYNPFNPAVVGRVFAQLCFSGKLKNYLGSNPGSTIQTGASITSTMQSLGWVTTQYDISLVDTILGNYAGTLGETFAFIIVILGVYLAIRNVIDWRISVTYVLTIFVTCLVIGFAGGLGVNSFEWAFRQILIGGVLFGAVFCLTDPVTSPTNQAGKVIFTLFAAFVTVAIRYQASAPEGVAYSILFANLVTPAINLVLKGKSNSLKWQKFTAMGVLLVCSLVFGLVFGLNHKVSNESENTNLTNTTETVSYVSEMPSDIYIEGGF